MRTLIVILLSSFLAPSYADDPDGDIMRLADAGQDAQQLEGGSPPIANTV